MTDSTGLLSEAVPSEATETQLAQAGDAIVVTESAAGTTIQTVAPGDSLQLNFDPADVAKAEIKDGNLEITFKDGGVAVIQGYEQWAAAGGQPTGPQGGVVDTARLGQGSAPTTEQAAGDEATVCEIPNANVVDVPVPAAGERLSLAVQPGDVIRLNCSFQDIAGAEVGDTLEMTFPGGGMVVVENFSAWIAAQGATVTDCVCGGLNLAEFILAIGLSPEDVLPAAGDSGGPGGDSDLTGSGFTPGAGPEILGGLAYPNILPPTGLNYGVPEPDRGLFPDEEEDPDGGPDARDDPPNAQKDILTVIEDTQPLTIIDIAAAALILDPEDAAPPRGPEEFKQDSTSIDVLPNDSFGPDGDGGIIDFEYIGDDPTTTTTVGAGQITVTDDEGVWEAVLITEGADRGKFTFNLLETYEHEEGQDANSAFEEFQYTIADSDGDTDSAKVTVQIVDDVPVAENDFTVFVTEGGEGGQPPETSVVTGNVLANDDKGADQFLPDGTFVTSISYTDENGDLVKDKAVPQDGTTVTVNTEHGTLTIDKSGDWTYESDDDVDHKGAPEEDGFTYTITDGDGDTSTAEQLIIVEDVVEPPDVTLAIGVDGEGGCVEEDSKLGDPDNQVAVHAEAQGDDNLVQLELTGFTNEPGWSFDLNGLKGAGVNVGASEFDTSDGKITLVFNSGVSVFDGTFFVQPPANSDVDLGTITATATAAASDDPTQQLSSSTDLEVTVDANADPVTVSVDVNDSGDANTTFQQNEIGTVQVTASFGDFQDGSEIHTVLVDVPDGFTLGALDNLPNGVTAQVVSGNNVLLTVAQGTSGFDYTFNVTNTGGGNGPANFTATATANENPPSDVECDPSDADNIETVVDTENEQKQDDTPVINPAPVTVEDDDTPGFDEGPTDETDPPNASATASLNASFGVDAPGNVVFGVNPNPAVLSNGDAITYAVSGDGKTLTATADAGGPDQRVAFTVVINNDGTYTFTLADALDHPLGGGENDLGLAFNVTATDNDGDSTGGVINVTVNDDSPISTGGQAGTVEEDNLPGGIDENAAINLTTSGSIGINFGADGPGDVSTITGPAGLASGGVAVTYSFDAATNTLTGSAGGDTVFTLSINPQTSQYNFTLAGPLDHPAGGGDEQALNLNFGFTATDFDGDPVNGSFAVAVRDDLPNANADSNVAQAQTVNLVIIFDRSGSMDEDPNVPGFSTRIDLARAAVASMLAAYESVADINIMVVDFATSADNSGWLGSAAEVNAYLAELDSDGTTNYNAAIQETMANYNNGLPPANQTFVYFLSDGNPNPVGTSLEASGTVDDWQNFLTDEAIDESIAVGIGGGVDDADGDLSDIAFPNDDPGNVIIVTDEVQVFDALVATVNVQASGNVLTDDPDDQFGADGPGTPQIVSIVVNVQGVGLTTFTFNGAQITNNNGLPVTVGATLVVITSLGGELTFDFGDGDYAYEAGTDATGQEQFTYTIADADGDTDSAVLTIDLDELQVEQPNRVFGTDGNDAALAGSSGIDVIGGGDGNDNISANGGDDHISGGAGADTIQGGDGNDVIVGGNQGELVIPPNPTGSIRAADLGDLLQGGAGDDFIIGNEGQDTIVGGTGNDTIDLTGPGPDTILYNSVLDGHDTVNAFDADQSNGTTDQLNLDALFDSLNVATANRAARVEIDDSGTVVEIRVDTNGDATFDLHVATLNTATNAAVTVGTEVIVGTQP